MQLEAEIARIQLNSLPSSIAERLLKRRDVAGLIEAGSAEVDGVGQFRFADVRNALAAAPLGTHVKVLGPDGSSISILRSADAMFRAEGSSGAETPLPELSLLDPSIEVRLEGIKRLSERALPNWPRSLSWQATVLESPLSDSDFGLVLDELQGVSEVVIGRIGQSLERGNFGVLDIFPTSATYYESLLGSIPWSICASQYINETLVPHLTAVFNKNASWGLRCVQAVSIAEAVDPVPIAALVSNDELMLAIKSVGCGRTPSGLLATYRLASSRNPVEKRFFEHSRRALDHLIERTCASDDTSDHDELLIALVRLTLSVVGQAEELALAPAFWRRLAAFAHATLLLEAVHISDKDAKDFASWFLTRLTRESAAVEVLDHLVEPGWRSDDLRAQGLWASALLFATRSTSGGLESPILSPAQLAQAEPHLLLVAGVPDPLSGARRDWATATTDVLGKSLLESVDSAKANGEAIESIQVWMALAHHAQIYPFDEGLLLRIRGLVKTSTPEARFVEAYATLILCCNVASTQGDLELAEVVVSRVIEASRGFTDPADASLAASIVVLAAGAAKDRAAGVQWAGERLLALAYRLPRGAICAAMAETIETFQRFIPVERRRWGKALIVARSAAA